MEKSANYSDIAQKNLMIRDLANSRNHDYSLVVESFNKVLVYKEGFRISLEDKLGFILKEVNGNVEKLETLMRNIEIYDQNIDKISSNLDNLYAEESSIKAKYEELLNGSSKQSETLDSHPEENPEDLDGSREVLIQRRRNYLENLDKIFKRLDNELFSIEKLISEFTHARGEILTKKDQAQKKIHILEETAKRLLEEVKRIEEELEFSASEEDQLISEFKVLLEKIETSLEISEEVDHILLTYLTTAEPKSISGNNRVSIQE